MWIADLRAVTLSSSAALRRPRPDAFRLAALYALREAKPETEVSALEAAWSRYEAVREAARWTEHREIPVGTFFAEGPGLQVPNPSAVEAAAGERLSASLEWQPDALPALDYLRESGYRTALLLDFPVPLSGVWLERLGQWFDAVVAAREVGLRTPAAPFFREVAKRLRVSPRFLLHVGEGLAEDVHGAQRVGSHAALLERRLRRPPNPAATEWLRRELGPASKAVRPDLKLRTLEDLAGAIDAFG